MSGWKKYYLTLTERFRQAAEYKKLRAGWPALSATLPKGDGHPVMVLPGFLADDDMTRPLRNALQEKGYAAYGWESGMNLGLTGKTVVCLRTRLKEIFEQNGGQKVSLIGHSLGGLFARELAREYPEMVRDVITVGSPFGLGVEIKAVAGWFRRLVEILGSNRLKLGEEEMAKRSLTPPPVPTTSIFSKTDMIAGWKGCLNPDVPEAENVHVDASHLGIINCLETYEVIFDRLAQPENGWTPYKNPAPDRKPQNPGWKPDTSSKPHLFKKK